MPPSKNKTGAARRYALAANPPISEIRSVIQDTIQVLIESFSEFSPKDRGLVARKGISVVAEIKRVRSPEIRREIACLQRAIEFLDAIELAMGNLTDDEIIRIPLVPRGTNPAAP